MAPVGGTDTRRTAEMERRTARGRRDMGTYEKRWAATSQEPRTAPSRLRKQPPTMLTVQFEPMATECPRIRKRTRRCGEKGNCITCKDYKGIYPFGDRQLMCNFKQKNDGGRTDKSNWTETARDRLLRRVPIFCPWHRWHQPQRLHRRIFYGRMHQRPASRHRHKAVRQQTKTLWKIWKDNTYIKNRDQSTPASSV